MRKRHNVKNQIEDESRKKNTEKSKKKSDIYWNDYEHLFLYQTREKKIGRKKFSIDLPFMRLFGTS